jgi:ferredoxin
VLDGKARLVSDFYCDGLGACIGACPEGAISIIEREADDYDERAVMKNIACQGESVIAAHLNHLVTNDQIIVYHQAIEFLHDHHITVPEHQSIELTLRSVQSSRMTAQDARDPQAGVSYGIPMLASLPHPLKPNRICGNGRSN